MPVLNTVGFSMPPYLNRLRALSDRLKWNGDQRIFCLSYQRTGTKSVGKFLADLGYPVASNKISARNKWGLKVCQGDFEGVFNSYDFLRHQAFEDGPWFAPDFHKVLFHRFPNSRFILFERDSSAWFQSMLSHSDGKSLGRTEVHAQIYNRMEEYLDLFDSGTPPKEMNGLNLAGFEAHYTSIYKSRNRQVRHYFAKHAPEKFFYARLEDQTKWNALARFLGKSKFAGDIHQNKSNR